MSSKVDSDTPRVMKKNEIVRDVVEFLRSVRTGIALGPGTGMGVSVKDRSSQLCALFAQAGFVQWGLLGEIGCTDAPELSLLTRSIPGCSGCYVVDGAVIRLRVDDQLDSLESVSSWVSRNGIDACGNVSVVREAQDILVKISTLS